MSQDTKEKILQTARKLFVEHGYSGTSMGAIGKEAKVTHSLLFHHFGNKQNLWLAVKQSIVQEAEDLQTTVPDTRLSFKEFLKQGFQNIIHFYQNNPDIIRLIQWQRLESSEEEIAVTKSKSSQEWMTAFHSYQDRNVISEDIKVEYIFTLFFAIAVNIVLDKSYILSNKESQQSYVDFCVNLLCKV